MDSEVQHAGHFALGASSSGVNKRRTTIGIPYHQYFCRNVCCGGGTIGLPSGVNGGGSRDIGVGTTDGRLRTMVVFVIEMRTAELEVEHDPSCGTRRMW